MTLVEGGQEWKGLSQKHLYVKVIPQRLRERFATVHKKACQ